jgi:3',5'-cyclic AMP phosphodiesterase CpdA
MNASARRLASSATVVISLAVVPLTDAQDLKLPSKGDVKFAVIGDMGTASREQREVGQRYYTFRASRSGLAKIVSGGVRFYALDPTYVDAQQLAWLEQELSSSSSDWKIAFFHHPLYSSGKTHGSSLDLRKTLEPLFVKYGANVVFSGHDHIYERVKPQQGITYFVSGSAGSLRRGDYGRPQAFSAIGFDSDFEFMLVEIDGSKMYFQAISRTGQTIDSGVVENAKATPESEAPAP